jgi:hypothetical protein
VLSNPADQVPDSGDFFLGWGGVGSGPVVEIGGGEDPFPVPQQVL